MNVEIEIKTNEIQSRFISVIKFIRIITGWGLKESKDFVDELRVLASRFRSI